MERPQSETPLEIQVKYFASLRERMGHGDTRLQVPAQSTVRTVWCLATGESSVPDRLLAAVNMEYVGWEHRVASGDEVAFFPPVTGG